MRDPLARLPIRYKLPLTFLLVCLLGLVAGGLLVSRFARDSMRSQIEARLAADVRAAALRIAAARHLLGRRVEDFASDGFIREHLAGLLAAHPAADAAALVRHLRVNKLPLVACFVDAAVLDDHGRIVARARAGSSARLAAVGVRALAAEGLWFSELADRDALDDFPSFWIGTPIRDLAGTRVLGRFIVRVHVGRFLASVPGMGEGAATATRFQLALSDQAGRELQLPSWLVNEAIANEELIDEAAGFRLVDAGAGAARRHPTDVWVSTHDLGADGWRVRAEVDGFAAMAPIRRLESRYLGTGLVIMAVALVAILVTVRFIVVPLNRLRVAAERVAGGEPGVRVELESGDEIGVVGDSFNAMARAVEERTLELERKRDELAAVVDAMHDGLCLLSPEGKVLLSNAAALPVERVLADLVPVPRPGACSETGRQCAGCLGSIADGARTCELEIDGRIYEVRASDLPAGGTIGGRLLVSRDITERLEMSRRQAFHERMSVAGELASAVAHEINNPLASISMFNQMMADDLASDSPFREHVDVIQRNAAACKTAIRDLLDNVRGGASEVAEIDLRDVVGDVVRFLGPLARNSGTSLSADVPSREALVTGDEMLLRQVLVNLTMNAIQAATGPTGTITIDVHVTDAEVAVDVTDDGPGMPVAIHQRIFDPFFTTKGVGEGTGLGLPTARRSIEAHGGSLTLEESARGRTRFRMRLPASASVATAVDAARRTS